MQIPEPCRIAGMDDSEALAVWGLVALAVIAVVSLVIALVTGGSYSPTEF